MLQESLAEYIIMWDDDIKPSANCLAAYVKAFRQHPEVCFLPSLPTRAGTALNTQNFKLSGAWQALSAGQRHNAS